MKVDPGKGQDGKKHQDEEGKHQESDSNASKSLVFGDVASIRFEEFLRSNEDENQTSEDWKMEYREKLRVQSTLRQTLTSKAS